jgi:hypothetical protein
LRDEAKVDALEVLNESDGKLLRKQYQNFLKERGIGNSKPKESEIVKYVNVQEYINQQNPTKEERNEIKVLDVKKK